MTLCEPTAPSLRMGICVFSVTQAWLFLRIFLHGKGAGDQKQQNIKMLEQNVRQ